LKSARNTCDKTKPRADLCCGLFGNKLFCGPPSLGVDAGSSTVQDAIWVLR
jgi:hypothetical protein